MNIDKLMESGLTNLIKGISQPLATAEIMMIFAFTGCMCLIIYGAYRLAHTRITYEGKFAVTLVVIAFVSTILMVLVQSNLALSLGMLGSLSIVRFRTNIKDPRDIGFVIWSMAIGIAAATQNYLIGTIGSLLLAVVMIVTKKNETEMKRMLLIVRGSNADIEVIQAIVSRHEGCTVKAKNILKDSFELVYEVNVRDSESNGIIEKIFQVEGIDSVNLLSQKGTI